LSIFIVGIFFHNIEIFSKQWFFYFVFFFLLSASHGILDAFTNGGLGIALLAPFDIVIKNEILWIWLPSLLIVIISTLIRAVMS
jgi:inner membrane protein